MRKICVVVGSRANYSSIKSAMRAIDEHPELELQVVAVASALLDRYGSVETLMKRDGFEPLAVFGTPVSRRRILLGDEAGQALEQSMA